MKVYLAVLDYSDCTVNMLTADTQNDCYQNEDIEPILEAKGYNLDEISYMTSLEPIQIKVQ